MKVLRILLYDGPEEHIARTLSKSISGTYKVGDLKIVEQCRMVIDEGYDEGKVITSPADSPLVNLDPFLKDRRSR